MINRFLRATFLLAVLLALAPGAGPSWATGPLAGLPGLSPPEIPGAAFRLELPLIYQDRCPDFTAVPLARRPAHFPPSALDGEITSPEPCESGLPAGVELEAAGSAQDIPGGVYLWLFAYAAGNTRYYPQCNNALAGQCGVELARGAWSVSLYLGRAGVKEHFYLVLVETDAAGHNFMAGKMKEWAQSGSFPGFLPSELKGYPVKELESLQVETAGG